MSEEKLTPKQALFVSEYLKTGNATEAAAAVGINCRKNAVGYYVYALVDPRNDSIFYVGKGKGKRIHQQVLDAKAGRVSNSFKHDRIKEILSEGLEVAEFVLFDRMSEDRAYAVERLLIERLAETLVNIANGIMTGNEHLIREIEFRIEQIEPKLVWIANLNPYGRRVTTSVCGSPEAFYDLYLNANLKLLRMVKDEYEKSHQK